jgi:hypothetical protein
MHYAGDRTMKRVVVVHEDGRVLRTYDIDLGDLDREPQVHWYFKQARENAIADKLVTESEANRIRCRFVDDLGEEKASEHPAAQASFLARKDADPAATKRIARIAKKVAWVAWIIVAIGAVIAISSTLSSP